MKRAVSVMAQEAQAMREVLAAQAMQAMQAMQAVQAMQEVPAVSPVRVAMQEVAEVRILVHLRRAIWSVPLVRTEVEIGEGQWVRLWVRLWVGLWVGL